MFKVYIKNSYRGSFKTAEEAMGHVVKHAKPFKYDWMIRDKFNKIYSQGS
jgi:hypothetical protein